MEDLVIDVAESNLQVEVIERSATTPVLVDFWADWCEPCKQLTPVLEEIVDEYGGAVVLARMNADEATRVTAALGIQSLPTVLLFRDGQPVDGFTGVQSADGIREILGRNGVGPLDGAGASPPAPPPEADDEVGLRSLLESDPTNSDALLSLSRLLCLRGDVGEAGEHIDQIAAGTPEARASERLKAAFAFWSAETPSEDSEPVDAIEALLDKARTAARSAAWEETAGALYEALAEDLGYRDGLTRLALVSVFGYAGEASDLTRRYQKRLANLLY